MKGGPGRKTKTINDFSGGQVTRPPEKGIDTKFSPDCLNVYAAGIPLKKCPGYTTQTSTALSGNGNGFFNWAKNAIDQVQMNYTGTTLSYRSVSSGAWSTLFTTVSPDSAGGRAFTNAIMHFRTFNNTLLMTTENRDKPQYMRVNDSSHFDFETGGAGTAPFAKYLEVWKNHVWLMNIGGGSEMSEDANSLTGWTDNDVGTGASTQTTFDGKSTFRLFAGGTSGDNARITKDIGSISDNYSFEIRTYFDALNTVASGDYAEHHVYNGNIQFSTRYSDDGLEIYDGTNWNEVGVNVVSEGSWITWKYTVTAATSSQARVDISKDGIPVGLQYSCAQVQTGSDGQIDIYSRAGASGTRSDWHIDYMYANAVTPVTNYLQNPRVESWGPLNGSSATFSTASQSYLQISDHAAFNFADGEFSIETRINRAAASTARIGLYTQSTDTANQIFFGILNNALIFSCVTGGTTIAYHSTASLSWNTNEWYEIGLFRQGSALYMMRRGQSLSVDATTSLGASALPNFSSNIFIGAWAGTANGLAGSLDEFRVSTTCRQTGGYHVDTANFSSDGSTSLLLHLDSNFNDSSSYVHTVTTASGVATATTPLGIFSWSASTSLTVAREGTTIKEGTYSVKLTGTGTFTQNLAIPSGIAGSSAYIAGWIKPPSSGQYQFFVTDGSSTYSSTVFSGASTDWEYRYFQFTTISSATNIVVNLSIISSNTFYADSLAVIPAGSVAFSSDFSDRVQRSAVGFYNDWTGTDSGYNDIVTSGDIGVTGSCVLNDRMYIFKKWSVHRLSYTGSFPLVDIKQVKKTVGTASPRSIRNVDIPGEGEMVMFLGTDRRLYLFDGVTPFPVSDEMTTNNGLSSVYFDNINVQALDKVWAVVHQDLNQYELFVPLGSNTTPSHSIIYDYVLKAFFPRSNRGFLSGDVSDDSLGRRRVYALTSTSGKLSLLNQGTNDDGSAINSYWTSPKIGTSQMLSVFDEIEVETAAVASSRPIFSWRCDWESTFANTYTMSSNTYNHLIASGRKDNLIQFKIADNSTTAAFELWAINLAERPIGIGK